MGDPGIVICVQSISKALKRNNVNYLKAYELLRRKKTEFIAKMDFIQGIEGMQLGLSSDDVLAVLINFVSVG